MIFLDREAPVPLYHQIYVQLRDEILSGQRPYGSALPTEQELSQTYQVSRITARRVLGDLARAHYVERKRRLGTRVTFQSPVKPIEANIDQAVDSLLAFGRGTTVSVVDVALEAASPAVASALHLESGQKVVRAVRIRLLDAEPLGHVVSYVPEVLAEAVTREKLAKAPILDLLAKAGRRAKHAEQTIGAVLADPGQAEALAVEPRSALLKITRTVFDGEGQAFLLTFAHYRSDRFQIRLDLNEPPTNEPLR